MAIVAPNAGKRANKYNYMKPYTPIRRFYAIVGFIHLILYTCLGIYLGIHAITKQDQEIVYPHAQEILDLIAVYK